MFAAPLLSSFLYVPGDRSDRMAKALDAEADAVLIDLEDSVAPSAKQKAAPRRRRGNYVTARTPSVLVGPHQHWKHRSCRCACSRRTRCGLGVVCFLAKCEDVAWLDEIASVLLDSVPTFPACVKAALGLRRMRAVCTSPAFCSVKLGHRLLADVGAHADGGPQLLSHAHAEILFASAAAQISLLSVGFTLYSRHRRT